MLSSSFGTENVYKRMNVMTEPKVKIAHCADVHLAPVFAEPDGKGSVGLAENTKAFFRMLDVCRENKVSLLLVAGDLFDQVPVSKEALSWFFQALLQYQDIQVVVIPGNHDPDTPDSPYAEEIAWPAHVTVVHGFTKIDVKNLPVTIWGCGYQKEKLDFSEVDAGKDRIQIGMFHGTLGHDFTEGDFSECGFDYVALGHIHKRSEAGYEKNPCYAYSGCLCGRGFDEQGEKGFYIATIEKGQTELEFCGSGAPQYRELSIKMQAGSNFGSRELLDRLREMTIGSGHYRIHFVGERTVDEELPLQELQDALSKEAEISLYDDREVRLKEEAMQALSGIKGLYVEKCQAFFEAAPEEEKELYMEAMRLGLRAFSQEVDYRVY